ncbi:MAG: hypothetical protein D6698_02875, partial [Gammaproteobacteria bacterium]
MKNCIHSVAATCLSLLAMLWTSPGYTQEALTLDKAIHEALNTHPGLKASKTHADALSFVPDQVNTLPEPRAFLNLQNIPTDSFSFTQENMTQIQTGVQQVFPFP